MHDAQIHFRINSQEKTEFDNTFKKLGLSSTDAIRMFIKKSIDVGGIPFEVNQPNQRLTNAINSKDYVNFDNAKDGLDWLND